MCDQIRSLEADTTAESIVGMRDSEKMKQRTAMGFVRMLLSFIFKNKTMDSTAPGEPQREV